jgi:hypothetical protein
LLDWAPEILNKEEQIKGKAAAVRKSSGRFATPPSCESFEQTLFGVE